MTISDPTEQADDEARQVGTTTFSRILLRLSVPDDIARLSTDTIYYGIGKGAEALAALALIPVLTRVFTPAQFGLWDVTMTFFMLTVLLASLALEPAVAAFYLETQQADKKRIVASTSLYFRIVSSVVAAVVIYLLAPQISIVVFNTAEHAEYFRIVSGAVPFFLIVNVCKQLLRVDFSPGKFNVVAVGYAALYAVLGMFFVTKLKMGVSGILLAVVAAAACFSFVGMFLSRKQLSFEFSGGTLMNMLAFGLPMLPTILGAWVIDFSDRYFLTRLSTLDQVGIYSVGARISSIIALFATSFQMAWIPRALSIQHEPDAKEKYSRGFYFFFLAALSAATAVVVFARPILVVLTQPKFYGAEKVIALLVLATVSYGAFLAISIGALITKKTFLASIAIMAGAVLNIILNFLLIPKFGMMGAATATLASYFVAFALLYGLLQRHYPIDFKIPRIAGLALLSISIMVVSSLLRFQKSIFIDILFGVLCIMIFLIVLKMFFLPKTSDR